ncbi:MAG: acetyl-CoA carboxylase biotin carboxyl carrier protein [Verrucomicrobiota bacterium]
MDQKELKKILELMKEYELTLFHLEQEGVNLKLEKGGAAPVMMAPPAPIAPVAAVAAAGPAAPAGEAAPSEPSGNDIPSPMVGTFYRSPSPDAKSFVKVGDSISEGQVICIIEAMKVMNEIKAETSGTITDILVEDATPVQYGQPLFRIS